MTTTTVTESQHRNLVAKLIDEANDGVRIRHCGRKTFSEDPVWRGLRVDAVSHSEIFNAAHASMDMVKAAFAIQNERGAWRELSAEEAWPIYEEAFISDRYHGFIFESDYHESYSCGGTTHRRALADRLADEADLCRNDGANDIATLLDEARMALGGVA